MLQNPERRTVSKTIKEFATVGDALKIYSPEELAFNILSLKCKKAHEIQKNTCLGYSRVLPNEGLKDVLSPELKKSRFIAFKEKFSENVFFKKPELGKALVLHSKPEELTNDNFVYGMKTSTSEGAYNIIFPNKTPQDVKDDKYLILHKCHWPSERIDRKYNEHFQPHATYGIATNVDKNGEMTKKCLQECDRMVVINKAHRKFLDRGSGLPEKKSDLCNLNIKSYQVFGIEKNNQSKFDVRARIENVEPSTKKIEAVDPVADINRLRRQLFNRSDFHMYDLKILLQKYDENGTGFITFNSIMRALHSLQIHVNEHKIRAAIRQFRIVKDENEATELVSIEEFWKMLHLQYPLQRKITIRGINKKSENQETTYRLLCSDRGKPIETQKIVRNLEYVDCTTSRDLIYPDLPLHYGLCSYDFHVLRPKEELRRIFKRLLPQNFAKIWEYAWSQKCEDEPSCKMSVNELRFFIDKYNNQHIV